MAGLVETEVASAGQADHGQQTPAFIGNASATDAALFKLFDFRVNVVAHKIELVLAVCRAWMNGQFCRWARKDKPALASVDCLEPEHVAEERAIALGIAAVNDRVQSVDHARAK